MRRIDALCRDASKLPPVMRSWYEATRPGAAVIDPDAAGLESVLQQAMRPVLIRCADAVMAQNRPGGLGASHLSAVRRRARSGRHHALRRSAG